MKFLMCVLVSVLGLSSCTSYVEASGDITVLDRNVGEYSAISVEDGLNLMIVNGDKGKISVTANDNIHQYIETNIRDNTLVVSVKRGAYFNNSNVYVRVYGGGLEAISASGGSRVELNKCPLASGFEVVLSGGSVLYGVADILRLESEISGGSILELTGTPAHTIDFVSSGGSKSYIDIETQNVEIEVSGGGEAYFWVSRNINVEASGGSKVYYKGDGNVGETELSGGSVVEHNDW